MFDIIFLSYDEPNADSNFQKLHQRFPHAQHLNGVSGIGAAHYAASKLANTGYFYVVDADAIINANFDFMYKPADDKKEYVHIWKAFNPVIGQTYGYGGVKLFHRRFFGKDKPYVDFSTSLTPFVEFVDEISCETHFNSDPFRTWRGTYREVTKLQHQINENKFINAAHKEQVRGFLDGWIKPVVNCNFRNEVLMGAAQALIDLQKNPNNIHNVNNYSFLEVQFKKYAKR